MDLQPFLIRLVTGRDLTEAESFRIFRKIFQGEIPRTEAKALLLLLAKKGEGEGELIGCLKALRSLEPPLKLSIPHLMDTCGTGGDYRSSVNVSTLAAFVIAGAGGRVAKHGNRSISSKCGSSDLVEALGVRLDAGKKKMIESIRRFGIGYFHAPFYHPAFSKVQDLRRKLKTRTIFNLLGPLANPFSLQHQLLGVSRSEHVSLFAKVLRRGGVRSAMVCHGEDGMDEISTAARTEAAWVTKKKIRRTSIDPKTFGFARSSPKDFSCSGIRHSRVIALALLQGKLKGPVRNLVLLNAAAGLVVSGLAKNLKQGIKMAEESIQSRKAYRALAGLRRLSKA